MQAEETKGGNSYGKPRPSLASTYDEQSQQEVAISSDL
jgi:hypothetical protein